MIIIYYYNLINWYKLVLFIALFFQLLNYLFKLFIFITIT